MTSSVSAWLHGKVGKVGKVRGKFGNVRYGLLWETHGGSRLAIFVPNVHI
jgi:hypothetical protein